MNCVPPNLYLVGLPKSRLLKIRFLFRALCLVLTRGRNCSLTILMAFPKENGTVEAIWRTGSGPHYLQSQSALIHAEKVHDDFLQWRLNQPFGGGILP